MIVKNVTPPHYSEVSYIGFIIEYLEKKLDNSYSLYLIHPDLQYVGGKELEEEIVKDSNFKIAIHLSNEVGFDSSYYDKLDIIFRFYLSKNCDLKKVYPINIGYNSSGKESIKPKSEKKILERNFDVTFIGNKNVRYDFTESISKISENYNIHFTDGFRQGLPIEEYYDMLSETKICLVPSGISPETFRYSESFGSGCVVITDNLDEAWYHQNSPAIVISDWSEVTKEFLDNILNSDLENLQTKGLDYYNNHLSPESNAEYILNVLKTKNK
jgi:hypothetical protein